MAIVLGVNKKIIKGITGLSDTIFFWDELPMALQQYIGTESYSFEGERSEIYLCCGNRIEVIAEISAIYNLHYDDRAIYGLKTSTSRQNCLETVYKLWCSNNSEDCDSNWIENERFYAYLRKIGFFSHNYGVLLSNIRKYIG